MGKGDGSNKGKDQRLIMNKEQKLIADTSNRVMEVDVIMRLMTEPELMKDVYGILTPNDFTYQDLVDVFSFMLARYERAETWNLMIISAELKEIKMSNVITADTSFTKAEFIQEVNRLKEYTLQRGVFSKADDILYKDRRPPQEVVLSAIDYFSKLESSTGKSTDLSSLLIKHGQLMTDRLDGKLTGIPTGFRDLDISLGNGFQKSDLILIGARPSIGKTSFSLTLAYNAAKAGYKTLFISVEMRDQDIIDRLLAFDMNYSCTSIVRGKVMKDKLDASYERLKTLPLSLVEVHKATSGDVYAIASKTKYTKGLDLVVVDYLQYLQDESNGDSESVRVGRISRTLKNLAGLLDVTVVSPVQLNRKSESRGGDLKGVPQLHDLRESGNLEQDADVVMLLHRDPMSEKPEDTALRIAKNRKGETGSIPLKFNRITTRFEI